jgi:hypothetical protein
MANHKHPLLFRHARALASSLQSTSLKHRRQPQPMRRQPQPMPQERPTPMGTAPPTGPTGTATPTGPTGTQDANSRCLCHRFAMRTAISACLWQKVLASLAAAPVIRSFPPPMDYATAACRHIGLTHGPPRQICFRACRSLSVSACKAKLPHQHQHPQSL